jgi:hypothetical protein
MIVGVLWGNCWIIYSFIVYVLKYILNGKLWINLEFCNLFLKISLDGSMAIHEFISMIFAK